MENFQEKNFQSVNGADIQNSTHGIQNPGKGQNALNYAGTVNGVPERPDLIVEKAPTIDNVVHGGVPDPNPKKKRGKKWLIVLFVALLVLVIGGGAATYFFVLRGSDEQGGQNPNSGTGTKPETVVEKKEMHVFELYPKQGEDVKNIEKAVPVIRERLAAVGIEGKVEAKKNKIVLELPKDFATDKESKDYFLELLTSKGFLYFGNYTVPVSKEPITEIESCEVVTEKTQTFIKYVKASLADEYVEELDEVGGDEVFFVHMKLGTSGALELKDALGKTATGDVYAYFDSEVMFNGNGGVSGVFIEGGQILETADSDAKELDIIPKIGMDDRKFAELLAHVLVNEPMKCSFDFVCVDEIVWEDDAEKMGEHQTTDVGGDYLVVEYEATYLSEPEDMDKSVKQLKARLDVYSAPYSIGYKEYDDEIVAVKFLPEKMNSDLVRLFAGKGIEIYNQYGRTGVYMQDFVIEKDNTGNPCMAVYFWDDKDTVAEKMLEGANGETMVYLLVNDVTVSSADVSELEDSSGELSKTVLRFRNLLCEDKNIDDDDMPLLDLIKFTYDEEYDDFPTSFSKMDYVYYKNNAKTTKKYNELPWRCNKHNVNDTVRNIIESNGAKVWMAHNERNSLTIEMDIPLDENLPAMYIEAVKKIFIECNFDDGSYANIEFCVKAPEDASPTDSASIYFRKSDGKMAFSSSFFNGPDFVQYSSAIKEVCESDEFFTARKD